MGHPQHNSCKGRSTRSERLGPRPCLRCGCHRVYQPRGWNQRYCQDPECQQEVRRWQSVKRQQRRRSRPEVREAHAAAERKRRARRREEGCTSTKTGHPRKDGEHDSCHHGEGCPLTSSTKTDSPVGDREPDRRAERCLPAVSMRRVWPQHASALGDHRKDCCPAPAIGVDPTEEDPTSGSGGGGAWSRSKKIPSPFCNRPGCYQAVRDCSRRQARYCSDECRRAMERVHDRERKWKARNTEAGRYKRSLEYEAARQARRAARRQLEAQGNSSCTTCRRGAVVNNRTSAKAGVSCRDPKEVPADDREKTVGHRPRAPPS